MSGVLRVLLADEQILFRKGVAALLAERPGLQVVADTGDGHEAIHLARELQPDILLLGLQLTGFCGFDVMRAVRREAPAIKAIVLTDSTDKEDLLKALWCGAHGYLLKSLEPAELIDQLERVPLGEHPMQPEMQTWLLGRISELRLAPRAVAGPPTEALTAREIEILCHIATGASNAEIAAALVITENTVKIHLRNILEKLHIRNRIQAAVYAAQHGLIDP